VSEQPKEQNQNKVKAPPPLTVRGFLSIQATYKKSKKKTATVENFNG
jgi:hypothetical protein